MKTTTKLLAILGIAGLAGFFNGTCQAADGIQTKINPKDGAEMVFVPAGPFKMGMDPMPMDEEQREQVNTPKHEVTLDGYWIYKYPVTVKQYKKYLEANKDEKPSWYFTGRMPPEPLWGWKDDHPMVNVTWGEAVGYAKWAGAELPTEAQWEKAARGTDERLYPWGNTWDPKLSIHSGAVWGDHKSTEPVGSHPGNVSPYGVMDMAGNVWQWCSDYFRKDWYSQPEASNAKEEPPQFIIRPNSKTEKNPNGERDWSQGRVARGGSWCLCDPKCFQSVNRDWNRAEGYRGMDTGFRCVVTGAPSPSSAQTTPPSPAPAATPSAAVASAPATGAQPVKPIPGGQTKDGKQQYLYTVDSSGGAVYKVNLADGTVECLCKTGPNVSVNIDSKGNLYAFGGFAARKTPGDDKMKPFLTGLTVAFSSVIDSKDNLYFGDYMGRQCRVWKIPLNKVTEDMLPFTVTYKDEPGKPWHIEDPDIKPAGVVVQVDNFSHQPYGFSCDAYDNIYIGNNAGHQYGDPDPDTNAYITKITPEGKVTRSNQGSQGVNTIIANADGGFAAIGGAIFMYTKNFKRIGMFAPGVDNHHSRGLAYDEQGNLYQANPPAKGEDPIDRSSPTPKDPKCRSSIYKYTPDGRRSVLATLGRSTWFCAIYPRTQYPRTKPAE